MTISTPWPGRGYRALGYALFLSSALAGCAHIPDLGPLPALNGPDVYEARATFSAPAVEWPEDRWWVGYGDAQLSALIDEALAGAPDLARAEARLEEADANARQAGAARLPQVGAKGSADAFYLDARDAPSFVPNGWSNRIQGSLNFSYEFDFWGKNKAALAAATSAAEAAKADAQAARLVLSTSVASAYADLAQLYSDLDAAKNARLVRTRTAELIAARRRGGLENEAAAKRAEAGRAEAEAQLAGIEESIALAQNRIAALLGKGPDRGLAIARPAPEMAKAFGLPTNLEADLIGRRPDVVAARLRVEAAAENIKVAKADFYPNVNLTALIATQTLGLASLPRMGASYGAVSPAVTLPIFEGGRLEGAYRGARAEYEESVSAYDGALAQALKDVADVAASARALNLRLGKSREALAASEQAYDIAQNRYRGGLSTYLDVLSAEDSLIADRRAVADLETRAFALDVALVRALGGGFHS